MKQLIHLAWRAVTIANLNGAFCLNITLGFVVGVLEGIGLLLLAPALSLATGQSLSPRLHAYLPTWNNGWLEIFLFGAFALLTILSAFVRFAVSNSSVGLRAGIEIALRRRLTQSLMKLRWTNYQGLRAGDLVKAITAEGHHCGWGVEYLALAISSLAVALFLLACSVLLGGMLALLVCLMAATLAIVLRFFGRRQKDASTELATLASRVGEMTEETVTSMKFLRATGLAGAAEQGLNNLYANYRAKTIENFRYPHMSRLALDVSGALIIITVIATSLLMTAIPMTQVLVFLMLFLRIAPRLQIAQEGFAQARNSLGWFEVWQERQARLMDTDPTYGTGNPNFAGDIELLNLEFAYSASGFRVGPLSLHVPFGTCIALLGHSGSGKTTLLDLITGLLQPDNGDIYLGGQSLGTLNIGALRQGIGLVMQDTPIFHASILDNICLFDSDRDETRARLSATKANALEFIEAQPKGFHTIIGERGGRISGGQRQRLALARALYRNPTILILDEATSNLDEASELAIVDALRHLKGKMTIVLATHRMALLQLADQIVTWKDGKLQPTAAICHPLDDEPETVGLPQ